MNSNNYCDKCSSVLNENTSKGDMFLDCKCGYSRPISDEETLRKSINISTIYELDDEIIEDLINDNTAERVKISCKCGCLIGVIRIIGENCQVIKACINCKSPLF